MADVNIMQRRSEGQKTTKEHSLLTTLKGLAVNNKLLVDTKIKVEEIVSTGTGRNELVCLNFSVPRSQTRSVDRETGTILVKSTGPHFTYTFSGKDSLSKSLKEFRAFYAKRSYALEKLQTELVASTLQELELKQQIKSEEKQLASFGHGD